MTEGGSLSDVETNGTFLERWVLNLLLIYLLGHLFEFYESFHVILMLFLTTILYLQDQVHLLCY